VRDGWPLSDLRFAAVWPGVRRAGLAKAEPGVMPGQRRRRRRLDQIRLNSANTARTTPHGRRRADDARTRRRGAWLCWLPGLPNTAGGPD